MVTASFGCGTKGNEVLKLRIEDLTFLSEGSGTSVGGVLYGVKSPSGTGSIKRVAFSSWKETSVIDLALSIVMQLVLVHACRHFTEKESSGPLFPGIQKNGVNHGV